MCGNGDHSANVTRLDKLEEMQVSRSYCTPKVACETDQPSNLSRPTYKFERQIFRTGRRHDHARPRTTDRARPRMTDHARTTAHDRPRTTAHDHARPTAHDHARPRTTTHDRPRTHDRARPRTTAHDHARPRTTTHDRPRTTDHGCHICLRKRYPPHPRGV